MTLLESLQALGFRFRIVVDEDGYNALKCVFAGQHAPKEAFDAISRNRVLLAEQLQEQERTERQSHAVTCH